jgi:hypothetical protein
MNLFNASKKHGNETGNEGVFRFHALQTKLKSRFLFSPMKETKNALRFRFRFRSFPVSCLYREETGNERGKMGVICHA